MASTSHHHARSNSLPGRSHPLIQRIDEELNKIRADEACNGLSGLPELHNCLDLLLKLPLTLQVLGQNHNEKWLNEVLDKSLKILDICGLMKEVASQFKQHVRDLQSSLRRTKVDSATIHQYSSSRKRMKKDAKRLLTNLKQMDHEIEGIELFDVDHHCSSVIRVLREVTASSIYIFQTILCNFLSVPLKNPKPTRWSLVSRLVRKGGASFDNKCATASELEIADAAMRSLHDNLSEIDRIQVAQTSLHALEDQFEDIENGLDGIFRCMIRSRSSLLNIFSC